MDFDTLCKDILNLDSKIRFAGVCDDSGGIKHGGQREGVTNLLSRRKPKDRICRPWPDGLYGAHYPQKSVKGNTQCQNIGRSNG